MSIVETTYSVSSFLMKGEDLALGRITV